MYLTPLTSLSWAYQLHYYLCFRTHRRRALFATASTANSLVALVSEICKRHDYHLLECQPYPDQLRCLVSLRPSQSISKVIQTIKTNSGRECGRSLGVRKPLWARGYLARSAGRVRIRAVRLYLERQSKHHGYEARLIAPIYRYRAPQIVPLKAAHSTFELNHHLVFATHQRLGIFSSAIAEALTAYWLKVATKRGFAIDQISIVPDHVHALVRIVPKMSIENCVLILLNNGQHFIGKSFSHELVQLGMNQLWQPSAYAGTCGELTTALIKHWLSQRE